MFANQLTDVIETVGAAANLISLVASDDRGHPLFADVRVSDDHDPARFCTHAGCRAFFHGGAAITNFRFLQKYLAPLPDKTARISFYGNRGTKF